MKTERPLPAEMQVPDQRGMTIRQQHEGVLRTLDTIDRRLAAMVTIDDALEVQAAAVAMEAYARKMRLADGMVRRAHGIWVKARTHVGGVLNAEAEKIKFYGRVHPMVTPLRVLAKQHGINESVVGTSRRLHKLSTVDPVAYAEFVAGVCAVRGAILDERLGNRVVDTRSSVTPDYQKRLQKFVVRLKDLERDWKSMVALLEGPGVNSTHGKGSLKAAYENLSGALQKVGAAATEELNTAHVETPQGYANRVKEQCAKSTVESQKSIVKGSPRDLRKKEVKRRMDVLRVEARKAARQAAEARA